MEKKRIFHSNWLAALQQKLERFLTSGSQEQEQQSQEAPIQRPDNMQYVIIGAGPAGVVAAEMLRQHNTEGYNFDW